MQWLGGGTGRRAAIDAVFGEVSRGAPGKPVDGYPERAGSNPAQAKTLDAS